MPRLTPTEHADSLKSEDSYSALIPATRKDDGKFRGSTRFLNQPADNDGQPTPTPSSSLLPGSTKLWPIRIADDEDDEDEDEDGQDEDDHDEDEDNSDSNDVEDSDSGDPHPGTESSIHAAASAANDKKEGSGPLRQHRETSREITEYTRHEQNICFPCETGKCNG